MYICIIDVNQSFKERSLVKFRGETECNALQAKPRVYDTLRLDGSRPLLDGQG